MFYYMQWWTKQAKWFFALDLEYPACFNTNTCQCQRQEAQTLVSESHHKMSELTQVKSSSFSHKQVRLIKMIKWEKRDTSKSPTTFQKQQEKYHAFSLVRARVFSALINVALQRIQPVSCLKWGPLIKTGRPTSCPYQNKSYYHGNFIDFAKGLIEWLLVST